MKKIFLSSTFMMKIMLSTAVFMTLFLGGCDNSNDPAPAPPEPTIVSLDVTPKAETLDVGTTQKYTVMAKFSDKSYQDVSDQVTWSLVNNNGSILFNQTDPSEAEALAIGTDIVVATLGALTTTDSERADVTVVDDALLSIAVTPTDQELIIGVDHPYTATGTYTGNRTQDLTDESDWVSGNTGFVTISKNGIASPVAEGDTTITASFGVLSDITNVGVSDPDKIEKIVISPEGYDFLTGEVKQFNALAHFVDPTRTPEVITKDCLWISGDTSLVSLVSGVGAKKGFFEAKDMTGSTTITAEFNIRQTATIAVTVEKPMVTRIEISPSVVTLSVGEERRFFTEAVDQRGKLYSINQHPDQEYTVDDPTILSIANDPDNAGRAKALSVGQATITSTFEYEGDIFITHALVTVEP